MRGYGSSAVAAGAAVLLFVAGCGGGDGAANTEVRRAVVDGDSVTVVESRAPAWDEGAGWTVADTPALVIGAGDRPGHALSDVAGAARLPDARVVVANGEPPELRWFGPDGELLRRVGGEGEGPGEFLQLSGFHRVGPDSLLALDSDLYRLSVFDDSGGYRGSVDLRRAMTRDGRPLYVYGIIGGVPGSGYLLQPGFPGGQRDPSEVYFDSVPAPVFAPDGSLADTLGAFRMQMFATPEIYTSLPFGRITRAAAGPGGVWTGDGDVAEVTRLSPEGEPTRVLRWAHRPPPLDEERIEAMVRERTEGLDQERREEARRRLEGMPLPDRVPAYDQLVVDAGGRLWAGRYRGRWSRGPTRWDVVDPERGWLGTVEVPRRLRVYAVGEEWILGLWRDELDVEHVVLFEIRKGGTAAS